MTHPKPSPYDSGMTPAKAYADVSGHLFPGGDPHLLAILTPALSDVDSPAYDEAHAFMSARMHGTHDAAEIRKWPGRARALMAKHGVSVDEGLVRDAQAASDHFDGNFAHLYPNHQRPTDPAPRKAEVGRAAQRIERTGGGGFRLSHHGGAPRDIDLAQTAAGHDEVVDLARAAFEEIDLVDDFLAGRRGVTVLRQSGDGKFRAAG